MAHALEIPASDGFLLGAQHYPAVGRARGWVVLNAAMGVAQSYYGPFAGFLAERGFHAVTWDYRGLGQSRPARAPFGLMTWARQDMEGVLRWTLMHGEPVMVLGHSLGTQLLGFAESAPRLRAVVGVASQSGGWNQWPFPADVGMWLLSHGLLPAIAALFGKVPKGMMGEEIPKGPIVDWARWIRSPDYLLSESDQVPALFARLTCAITGLSIEDDGYAPRKAVDALYRIYVNAKVERVHLVPKDYGLKAIGHFGPFRRQFRDTLWPVMARPLEAAL